MLGVIMKIDYQEWTYLSYVDEIRRQQKIYEKQNRAYKLFIEQEIAEQQTKFDNLIKNANDYEEASLIDDYQENVSLIMVGYYNELSSMFQKMYSIFENQVALESRFDLSKYPKINEVKDVVNVLKHNNGRSYNTLRSANSKFLEPSKEFSKITFGCSSIILNIEYRDLEEFCDEVVKAWCDRIKEYKEEGNLSTEI